MTTGSRADDIGQMTVVLNVREKEHFTRVPGYVLTVPNMKTARGDDVKAWLTGEAYLDLKAWMDRRKDFPGHFSPYLFSRHRVAKLVLGASANGWTLCPAWPAMGPSTLLPIAAVWDLNAVGLPGFSVMGDSATMHTSAYSPPGYGPSRVPQLSVIVI